MSERTRRPAVLLGLLLGMPLAALATTAPAGDVAPAVTPTPAPGLSFTGSSTSGSPAPSSPSALPTTTPAGAADPAQTVEDIRDIRGPKYGVPLWVIAAVLGGAALLALAGYGLWRWLRRRRQPRALQPFELALQRLDAIRPLMQPAGAREFSIAVSDIVRTYIEQRFDVVATYRTTEEFLHDLLETPKPSLARHRALLAGFLQQCDLVKFGGVSLSMHDIESLHESARGFVLETAKPDPAAPPTPTPKEAHDTLPAT